MEPIATTESVQNCPSLDPANGGEGLVSWGPRVILGKGHKTNTHFLCLVIVPSQIGGTQGRMSTLGRTVSTLTPETQLILTMGSF